MYNHNELSITGQVFHTIHTRVVIIDGFDNTAEVKLNILLNKSRVEWTEMATLVINTATHIVIPYDWQKL